MLFIYLQGREFSMFWQNQAKLIKTTKVFQGVQFDTFHQHKRSKRISCFKVMQVFFVLINTIKKATIVYALYTVIVVCLHY